MSKPIYITALELEMLSQQLPIENHDLLNGDQLYMYSRAHRLGHSQQALAAASPDVKN